MKKIILLVTMLVMVMVAVVECKFHNRRIFVSKFAGNTKSSLTQIKVIRKQIHDNALRSLYSLEPEIKKDLLQQADLTYNNDSYPVKTAWEFMEFSRNGNRVHYERKMHSQRKRMVWLVVGHLLDREHNQTSTRYIDEIVNGIWMVMEESTWCYPAHLYLENTGQRLSAPEHYSLDLNAGDLAKFLGWVKLMLADRFDQVSTVINQRIDYELHRRVFQPYLNHNYFWEGFGGAHDVNNWNIWINANILKSALFTLDNEQLFNAVLNRTLYSADYFLDNYGEDGGCDEGPAYWRQAGGRLIEYIEALVQIYGTAAKDYFKSVQLIKRIGEYTYKMLITKNWFVNFADSEPPQSYPPALLAQYGILFDDENMKRFAGYMLQYDSASHTNYHHLPPDYDDERGADINEFFNNVMLRQQMNSFNKTAPMQPLVWLPDIQVVNARSTKLYIAAKAGTNHESHNHNDVGHFILYQNGTPVLIDIGVGLYTAQTFSGHRYDLFYMQSQYHNCPTINGVAQHDGSKYESKNVSLKQFANEEGFHFTSDISGAYPSNTAQVTHWIRSIQFNKTSNVVTLEDEYELKKFLKPQELHFILTEKVSHQKNEHGLWLYSADKKTVSIQMNFDWSVFQLDELTKSLDNDLHLTRVWGANVRRLTLKTVPSYNELKGKFVIQFMPK